MNLSGRYLGGMDKGSRTKWLIAITGIVVVALLVGASSAATYFYMKYRNLQQQTAQSSEQRSEAGTQLSERGVAERVGRLYNAPNEKPTIAQVNDQDKLSDQTFFDNAEKDDYVLVYPKAKIVILYRATVDRIINIGPIDIENR